MEHWCCYDCVVAADVKVAGIPLQFSMMIVCPECGNKRCPRGTNHENPCTGSNALGQAGSRY